AVATIRNDDAFEVGPAADTYVRDGRHRGTSFGSAAELQVERGLLAGQTRRAFLRFDVPSLIRGRVRRATLRLFVRSTGGRHEHVSVAPVASDTWSEAGTTWTSQQRTQARRATAPVQAQRWVELDVTAFVN